jgi:hypothetical protein
MHRLALIALLAGTAQAADLPPQMIYGGPNSATYYSKDGYTYGTDGSVMVQSGGVTMVQPGASQNGGRPATGTTYFKAGDTTYGTDGSAASVSQGGSVTNVYAPVTAPAAVPFGSFAAPAAAAPAFGEF